MVDVTKKAAGYIQVKLIPADRNGQTWSGWTQRWVDLLIVSQDSGQSKRDKIPEVWIEIRKSKSSGKPNKMWTVNARDTVLYRCTSKRKTHAFAIQYKGKDIVYLSGNSESESNDWMKIIRESLCPTDKIVELEVSTERLFEASVIDNSYSASCGLFGKYGHLACRENKLIMFDNNGSNVIQEWYLHTIRKLEAFKANVSDKAQILTVYLGENSSTGCGVIYYFCPNALSLLKSIQTRIKDIFNNIEDDLKVQQATLMSLGALHDVSLDESDVKEPSMTLIIADEIIKAKQELSQGKRLQALRPVVREATNKDEPFVWKDNEFYDEEAVVVKSRVKADYTPPDEEPPKKPRRASLSQSLNFMRRPRAHSANPEPESSKIKNQPRRSSLPQSGRFRPKSPADNCEDEFDFQLQKFKHVLNLADPENSEQIFPVVGSPKSQTVKMESDESCQTTISPLSALDECSEGTTSRSASLSSFNVSMTEDKATDVVDSKPELPKDHETPSKPVKLQPAESGESKTDNEDSLTEELGDVTVESIDSIKLDAVGLNVALEPDLDLRLREPAEEESTEQNQHQEKEAVTLGDTTAKTATRVAEESVDEVIAQSVARVEESISSVGTDSRDAEGDLAPTVAMDEDDRRGSTHAVQINFGAPPKPKRASRVYQ